MDTFKYVIDVPYFWGSMGITTSIAMFVGAAIYDGRLDQVSKALLSVISYVGMMLWVSLSRISHAIETNQANFTKMALAGPMSVVILTLFWLLGVFMGVMLFKIKYRKNRV